MTNKHDSRASATPKDAAPCRGEFEATREAWIRWLAKSNLEDCFKFFGAYYISIYSSREVHNAERALVAWAKNETLAGDLGLSVCQAGRRLKRLVDRGYLTRWTGEVPRGEREERRGRPSAAYRFTMPPAEYFVRTWREKLTRIFVHSGCTKLEGIFVHLRNEFCASGDLFCASHDEEVPVAVGVAPGLSDRLSEKRLTEQDIAALRAATGESQLRARGEFAWGEIGFTTSDGKPITAAPTFEEFIEYSDGQELVEFFRDYVDDNGHLIETAAEPDDTGHKPDSCASATVESMDVASEREVREKRERELRAKHNIPEGEPLF